MNSIREFCDVEAQIEALAKYSHSAWSQWMKYLFSKTERFAKEVGMTPGCRVLHEYNHGAFIPEAQVERWTRQMNTDYSELPESEKESDRAEALKIIDLLNKLENK